MSRAIGVGVFSKELRGSSGDVGECVDRCKDAWIWQRWPQLNQDKYKYNLFKMCGVLFCLILPLSLWHQGPGTCCSHQPTDPLSGLQSRDALNSFWLTAGQGGIDGEELFSRAFQSEFSRMPCWIRCVAWGGWLFYWLGTTKNAGIKAKCGGRYL